MKFYVATYLNLCLLLFFCAPFSLRGQTQNSKPSTSKNVILTGRVIETKNRLPLVSAVVQAFAMDKADSTVIGQQLTDSLGHFCFRVEADSRKVYLIAAFMGYYLARQRIDSLFVTDTVRLGTLRMRPTDLVLKSAFVRGRRKFFKVVGDSVVFDPAAFKLDKGARMDELMEQLPGVQIHDGQYYWMGKPVSIVFNGKELFKRGETVLNGLPSEAIENVKAYKKGDKDVDPNLRGKMVLDINVKKKWMEAWYGNVRAGAGDHAKYVGQIEATHLSEKTPTTIKSNINNIGENHRFNGNWSDIEPEEPMTEQILNVQFSKNDKMGKKGHYSFDANGGFSHTNKRANNGYSSTMALNDSSSDFSIRKGHQFICDKNAKWSFSGGVSHPNTSLSFYGQFNHEEGRSTRLSHTAQFDKDPYALDDSPLDHPDKVREAMLHVATDRQYDSHHGNQGSLSGTLYYDFKNRSFFTFRVGADFSDSKSRSFARGDIHYFRNPEKQNELVNQYTLSPYSYMNTSFVAQWKTNLIKKFVSMEVRYTLSPRYSHSESSLYRLERLGDVLDFGILPTDSLMQRTFDASNSYRSSFHKLEHEFSIQFDFSFKEHVVNIYPRLIFVPTREHLDYVRGRIDTSVVRHVAPLRPSLTFNISFGKLGSSSLTYECFTRYPDLENLIPYTDDSSPLSIVKSNPNLKPSHNHSFNLSTMFYWPKNQQTFSNNVTYFFSSSSFGNVTRYNQLTGGRIYQMENLKGDMNLNENCDYMCSLGDHLQIKFNDNIRYNTSVGKICVGTDPEVRENRMRLFSSNGNLSGSYSFTKLIGTLRGILQYEHMTNLLQPVNNTSRWDYGGCVETKWRNRLANVSTDFTLLRRRGYVEPSMNKWIKLWNLSLERKIFNYHGTLLLTLSDIFHEKTNYQYYIYENYHSESWSDIAVNYVLFTFRYNLEQKKK